ncbi:MAG TPA: hypothetical protein VLM79_28190 [Kofleriaceae bacterium]|nr:hypothetical protein [Kofleriaceae bacterium]
MRKLVIATIVLALVAGCGSGSVALRDYPSAVRGAYCAHLVSCGEMESIQTCLGVNTGFDFRIGELDLRLSASIAAAIGASTIEYDGDAAKRCLDALGTRGCDPTTEAARTVPDDCLQIFNGRLHADDACARNDECISRQCDVPACEDACCTGVCIGDEPLPRAQLDEPCDFAVCDDGLFCDEGSGTCAALKSQGGFCVSISECRVGLYCNQSGECAGNLPALGQPCTGPCREEGTQCSVSSRTCVAVALVGQPCQMSSDCSPFYSCDSTKRCVAGIALGDPCTMSTRCADFGAFCDIAPGDLVGVCAMTKADDEQCQGDYACQSGICDDTTRACVPEPVCI